MNRISQNSSGDNRPVKLLISSLIDFSETKFTEIHWFSEFLNFNHTSCIFLNKIQLWLNFAKKCHWYNYKEYLFKPTYQLWFWFFIYFQDKCEFFFENQGVIYENFREWQFLRDKISLLYVVWCRIVNLLKIGSIKCKKF